MQLVSDLSSLDSNLSTKVRLPTRRSSQSMSRFCEPVSWCAKFRKAATLAFLRTFHFTTTNRQRDDSTSLALFTVATNTHTLALLLPLSPLPLHPNSLFASFLSLCTGSKASKSAWQAMDGHQISSELSLVLFSQKQDWWDSLAFQNFRQRDIRQMYRFKQGCSRSRAQGSYLQGVWTEDVVEYRLEIVQTWEVSPLPLCQTAA